jgi:hypothetical protein
MTSPTITVELLEKRAEEIGQQNSGWYLDWTPGIPGHQLINREWHPADLDSLLDGVDDDHREMLLRDYSAQLFAIAVKSAHEAESV